MKIYEITILTKEDPAEKDVKDMLSKMEAKVLGVTALGEKQLAYKIKKETKGFLTVVLLELDPEKLSGLNKKLTLSDEILRFIIVAKKPAELLAPKKAEIKEAEKATTEATKEKEVALTEEVLPAPEVEEDTELVVKTQETKEEPAEVKKEAAKPKAEVKEKAEKTEKKPAEKPVKKAAPKVVKEEKVIEKDTEVKEIEKETETEEDRLKELDKKLDELLKD